MSDPRETTNEVDAPEAPEWQIEGGDTTGDGSGLGDTVVRIPRITDDGPVPASPKSRAGGIRSGRPPAKSGQAAAAADSPDGDSADAASVPEPGSEELPEIASAAPADAAAEAVVSESEAVSADAVSTDSESDTAVAETDVAEEGIEPVATEVVETNTETIATFAPFPGAAGADPVEGAAVPPAPVAAAAPKPKSSLRRTRKARLRLSRVDPWSVMKTSFLFSIAFGISLWVAVSVLWSVVTTSGLFEIVNVQVGQILSSPQAESTFRVEDYISTPKVLGITALVAVFNVVIGTALGTLSAFLYNLSAGILGGLELTLAED